jgi:putative hydrolase of the HAD superfamily
MTRFRAVLYDFDGVIRLWDEAETRSIEERFGLPAGAVGAAAFDPSLLERAVTGRIPDETWRLAIRNALVRAHGPGAADAEAAWSARTGRIDDRVVDLIAAFRPRLRTGLLTNATTRLETDLQAFRLDKAFDVVINSARIGFCKPDPRIYRAASNRIGFPLDTCIYVDDTPGHVAAAREVGMMAIHYQDVDALRASLDHLTA